MRTGDLKKCMPKKNSRLKLLRRCLKKYLKNEIGPVVKLSLQREMAQRANKNASVSIRARCHAFGISEECYRYQAKLFTENEEIAGWLLSPSSTHKCGVLVIQ
jgi:hypothetical protein